LEGADPLTRHVNDAQSLRITPENVLDPDFPIGDGLIQAAEDIAVLEPGSLLSPEYGLLLVVSRGHRRLVDIVDDLIRCP
jgi:hypothetical protein